MSSPIVHSKEYYNQLNKRMYDDQKAIDYHASMAIHYKKIYQLTQGRYGIYKLLNKIAKKLNLYHCEKGSKLCIDDLFQLSNEMDYLTNYIEGESTC